ncbi:MAG TPA: hypothetical protein VN259_09025 [Xanthomonadales bacterium]|nr:hypothetical protein [Xanthomonadales bacterium]
MSTEQYSGVTNDHDREPGLANAEVANGFEEDFWGDGGAQAASAASAPGQADASPSAAAAQPPEDALDVDSTDVPRKKSKMIPIVIGVVFLAAMGTVGSALWSAYQKFAPPSPGGAGETRRSGAAGGGVIDMAAAPQAPAQKESSLPAPGNAAGGVILFPSSPASAASSTVAGAAAPVFASGVDPALAAPPAPPAPAAPPVTAPAAPAQPVAGEPAAQVAPAAPVPQPEAPAPKKEPVKKQAAARAVSSAPADSVQPKAPKPKKEAVKRSAVARPSAGTPASKTASVKEARGGASASSRKPAQTERVEAGLGQLSRYKVLSIWPRTGEFQQAWISSAGSPGKVYIVRAGDELDGMRVLSVDSAANRVQTNHGEIR